MTTLAVREVTHIYAESRSSVQALTNVSFEAEAGQMIAVVGQSGCGKSTLLSIIGQVIAPTDGTINIDGESAPRGDAARTRLRNSTFGFLFQDFALVETTTSAKNVEVPLRYSRATVGRAERRRRVRDLLDSLGVLDCADRPVRLLSGGQRQRVALARALVTSPKIILADEPTGALDSENGDIVLRLLQRQTSVGKTVILATHNLDLALSCDRVIALQDGVMVDPAAMFPRRAVVGNRATTNPGS